MYGTLLRLRLLNSSELAFFLYESEAFLCAIRELIKKDELTLSEILIQLEKKMKGDSRILALKNELELQLSYNNFEFGEDILLVNEIHRQQRYSKLLIIFAFYEGTLKRLVDLKGYNSKKDNKSKLSIIEQHRNQLIGSTRNAPVSNTSFDYISSQGFARNKIAHNNGECNKKEIPKFKKQEGIELQESGDKYILKIADPIYLTNLTEHIKMDLIEIIYSLDIPC